MLYPVELRAQQEGVYRSCLPVVPTPAGRGRGIRTLDIQLPKLALYQAELYPADNQHSAPAVQAKSARQPDQLQPASASVHRGNRSSCTGERVSSNNKKGAEAPFANLARPERFELPTTKFVAWYSIQLSYGREEAELFRHNVLTSTPNRS